MTEVIASILPTKNDNEIYLNYWLNNDPSQFVSIWRPGFNINSTFSGLSKIKLKSWLLTFTSFLCSIDKKIRSIHICTKKTAAKANFSNHCYFLFKRLLKSNTNQYCIDQRFFKGTIKLTVSTKSTVHFWMHVKTLPRKSFWPNISLRTQSIHNNVTVPAVQIKTKIETNTYEHMQQLNLTLSVTSSKYQLFLKIRNACHSMLSIRLKFSCRWPLEWFWLHRRRNDLGEMAHCTVQEKSLISFNFWQLIFGDTLAVTSLQREWRRAIFIARWTRDIL